MHSQATQVMTIANSIIGVSILAMPYCFKQCGIVLSVLILIISSIISRLSCHLLLKSAILARRRTFEFLAFHAFGSLGKFIVEVGLIGFLLGTSIAFFVIMGDLGPAIVSKIFGTQPTDTMRTTILIALALFCVLPLGLLRNIDSLSSVCTATIGFYFCLVLKIVAESVSHIFSGDSYETVELWRPLGILQCLPIFSMALFCQTQIFEIYQVIPNASLEKMNELIRMAVNSCTGAYIFVGTFGYIAFSSQTFTGNILMSFSNSFMSDVMKIGFVLSVAFSFPLVIFPCRASLHSLLYKQGYSLHDSADKYIPEGRFKGLTFLIVLVSLITGVMIPNIEFVLGLVGSTIGIMICVLFPATCFICISSKNTNERILAQIMLFVGIIVMVLGTYANLYAMEEMANNNPFTEKVNVVVKPDILKILKEDPSLKVIDIPNTTKAPIVSEKKEEVKQVEVLKEVRHEPPQPEEPAEVNNGPIQEVKPPESPLKDTNIETPIVQSEANEINKKVAESSVIQEPIKVETNVPDQRMGVKESQTVTPEVNKISPILKPVGVGEAIQNHLQENLKINNKKAEEVDIEAIRKEEKELLEQEKENLKQEEIKNMDLIKNLEKQNEAQMKLVEDSKKILEEIKQAQQVLGQNQQQKEIDKVKEEKLKAVEQIGEIAKKAIAKISGNDENFNKPLETERKSDKEPDNSKELNVVNANNEDSRKDVVQNIKHDGINMLIPLPIVVSNNLSSVYGNLSINHKDVVPKLDQTLNIKIEQNPENVAKTNNTEDRGSKREDTNQVNNKNGDQINILNVLRANAQKTTILTKEKQEDIIQHREIRSADNKQLINEPEKDYTQQSLKHDLNEEQQNDETCNKKNENLKGNNNIKNSNLDSTESSIIKMFTKLSHPELVKLSDLDSVNIDNTVVKLSKRDLKSYKATRRK